MPQPKNQYDPKRDVGAQLRFLNGLMEKMTRQVQHLDMQVNILIGLSSAIVVLSISRSGSAFTLSPLLILSTCSGASALVGLFAIHPPKFMRKRKQPESLLYNKTIMDFPSSSAYERELATIVGDQSAMTKQYAIEVYNLARFIYRPKRRLFKLSRNILLFGIVVSILFFLVQTIITFYP
ncbi:hypothetical protein HY629_02300 [Candidatus Uhrbacteria bacterium]|nr:hypothetical protein [Candidatus Uhrbacteria bacterium]